MSLDTAKFNLEVFRTRAQVHSNLLQAYADINMKMAQVAEKQVKVAKDKEELYQLKQSHKEYKLALTKIKQKIHKAERKDRTLDMRTREAKLLSWGEYLSPRLVGRAWIGYKYLVSKEPELVAIKIEDDLRAGNWYSYNHKPTKPCKNVPEQVTTAMGIFEWCRKNSYVPKIGSPPYELLVQVLDTIKKRAEQELELLTTELDNINNQLLALRSTNWKQLKIADYPPKT